MIGRYRRRVGAAVLALGGWLATAAPSVAQPAPGAEGEPAPPAVVQVAAPTADDADPTAVSACAQFAAVLDGTATYYGEFASAIEGFARPDYSDPAVSSTNITGRTALRQGASAALDAANTPGLSSDIAGPMRAWSWDATKLLLKMGLRGGPDTLNGAATELNDNALAVQGACAAAGTHA